MSTLFRGPPKPQAQARKYVYRIIGAILENSDERRWFFDGVDDEFDRRRIRKAIDAVQKEMFRKGRAVDPPEAP